MTQDDKLVTRASYILSKGWVNSFYWQRNHKGKLGEEVGFLNACVPQHTQRCHIFLCTYQVLHNKIKHLKIKRKRKHEEKPSHSQTASGLLCLALSPPAQPGYQGQPQRAPAQLAGPGFSGPTQQETRASSWVSIKREWSSALPSIALSSSFLCHEFAMNSWQVSFRSITELSLCSTSIPCLDFNRSLQPSDNRLLWVSCWSNSLSKQIKLLEHELHSFLPIAPSYSRGFHFPLTLAHHPAWKNTHSLPFWHMSLGGGGGVPYPFCLLQPSSFNCTIPFQNDLQFLSPRTLFYLRSSHLLALEPNCDLFVKKKSLKLENTGNFKKYSSGLPCWRSG